MATSSEGLARRVAAEIRAEMARQRITQVELANRLTRAQPWVSRRVSGHVPLALDELEQIAAVLDVPLAQLFGWTRRVDDQQGRPGPPRASGFA